LRLGRILWAFFKQITDARFDLATLGAAVREMSAFWGAGGKHPENGTQRNAISTFP